MRALSLITACALFGATAAANASTYVATIEQVGSNVVATGSGSFDLTDLTLFNTFVQPFGAVESGIAALLLGSGAITTTTLAGYSGLSGPTSFGTGGTEITTTTTNGPTTAINGTGLGGSGAFIAVPTGYVSDTVLSTSTNTFVGATLASLLLTPGHYVWTWGTGMHQGSYTLDIGTVPLPATLPLFATGLAGLGLLGWRRKKKVAVLSA
jgi:hypothetical protein